jgi:hypothetical protein
MRKRRDVLDRPDCQSRLVEGLNGRLPTTSGAVHFDFHFADPEFLSILRTDLGGPLGGKGSALSATLEADRSSRSPGQHVAVAVGDRHDGVVEAALNVDNPLRDVPSRSFLLRVSHDTCQLISKRDLFEPKPLLPGSSDFAQRGHFVDPDRHYRRSFTPFLPATVFLGPLRVRALVRVRCPRTGRLFRCRVPRNEPISLRR